MHQYDMKSHDHMTVWYKLVQYYQFNVNVNVKIGIN